MQNNYPEFAISAITFVLNSAVLSSFIIPEVRKLKEIKDGLFKYKISYAPTSGTFPEIADGGKKQDVEIERLQTLLDIYAVRASELNSVTEKFYYSVFVALCAILLSVVFPKSIETIFVLHPIAQLLILIHAIKTYVADPDRVASPEYLVRNCEVNIHSLIQALDVSVYYDAGKSKVTPDDPLIFNMSLGMRVYGFRFAFIIADKDQKVYFLSYGPVNAKTELWRHMLHPGYGKAEHDRVPIGKFKLNSYKEAKEFDVYLLLFMPVYPHETVSPMIGEGNIEANPDQMIVSRSSFVSISNFGAVYRGITFKGIGEKIEEMNILDSYPKPNNVINSVFKKYGTDFRMAKELKTFESYTGKGIV